MSATKESMIAATDRLRREGRWDEAQQYRDQVRKALLAEGKKRAEAREASWEAMIEEYPPLPDAPEVEGAALPEAEVPAEWSHSGAPDLTGDFLWVYSNLGKSAAKPSDAPGPGAWAMLAWARANTNRFFDQFASKANALLARAEEDRRRQEEAEQHDEALENRLVTFMESFMSAEGRRLALNVPAGIQNEVLEGVESVRKKHNIEMPQDALEDLEVEMLEIADSLIKRVLAAPNAFKKGAKKDGDEEELEGAEAWRARNGYGRM